MVFAALTLYPLYLSRARNSQCMRIGAQVRITSPNLKHTWSIRTTVENDSLAAAQHARKMWSDEPATVREVLPVHDDVLDVFCILGVKLPVDLGLGKQKTNALCTYANWSDYLARRRMRAVD